jgi:hypothetical protein
MSSKLSTAQRTQIINDYLDGVLTLEYKVKELDDGKYRVSRRSAAEIQKMKEEYNIQELEQKETNAQEESEVNEEITEEAPSSEEPKPKPEPVKPKIKPAPPKPTPRPKPVKNEVIESLHQTNQEILNHLRLLGEEKAKKRQKKEVKREVKHRISKFYKEPVVEYSEEEEIDEPPPIEKPKYQRKRLNLFDS